MQQVGAPCDFGECRAQVAVADRLGDAAAPQTHVEIGVLAAEELDHPRATDLAPAERPQEEGFARRVEAGNDEGRDARRHADMALPQLEEVEPLVGRGE